MQQRDSLPSRHNTMCAQPWVGLQIRPDKGMRPCCMFPYNVASFDSPDSLSRFHTSEKLAHIRKKMLQGELPAECYGCKKEEELTGTSPRLFSPGFSQSFEEHERSLILNKVEFFVSNTCNLDCVMCNPTFSSKWNSLVSELNENQINFNRFQKMEVERIDPLIIDSVFERARHAQEVLLLGGEPFASKEVLLFIERWVQEECSGPLTIISNGTLLTPDIVNLLSRCKNLLLLLSIDAVGSLYEWIRGYEWSKIEQNILNAKKNIQRLTLTPTIAAYNVLGIGDLCHFSDQHQLRYKVDHILSQPDFLNLELLPPQLRHSLALQLSDMKNEKLDKLIAALRMDFADVSMEKKKRFAQWCEFFNKKRKIDLFQLYPQLNTLLT